MGEYKLSPLYKSLGREDISSMLALLSPLLWVFLLPSFSAVYTTSIYLSSKMRSNDSVHVCFEDIRHLRTKNESEDRSEIEINKRSPS